jgi:uncharacterized Zn finger protein
MDSLRKKGVDIQPVEIEGRKIAKTFWGEAWCDHLEAFSDYENRLPRGRTYVRNGSVCHLEINKGEILAKVTGSELYNLRIRIKTLPKKKWTAIKGRCAGQVASLLELLQGKLSDHVMGVVTDRKDGLFPSPREISLNCSCPDWAVMCKHVAAVLYGVGARLDRQPELLFKLRGVDHEELIAADAEAAVSAATSRGKSKRLSGGELSDVFGIDLDLSGDSNAASPRRKMRSTKAKAGTRRKKAVVKKAVKKKAVRKKATAKKKMKVAKKTTKKKADLKKATKKKAAPKKVAKKTAVKKRVLKSTKPSTKKKAATKKKVVKKAPRKTPRTKKTTRKPR